MKFVLVLHDAQLYGSGYCALDLATGLKSLGHTCVFLVPENGPFVKVLSENGYESYLLDYESWAVYRPSLYQNKYVSSNRFLRFVKLFHFGWRHFLLARQMRKSLGKVDWIISNNALVVFGFILSKVTGSKHVWQFREFVGEGTDYSYIFSTTVRRYIYSKPAKFIYSTQALKSYYGSDTRNQGKAIIDPHIFIPHEKEAFQKTSGKLKTFGMLGSVNGNKGQLEIVHFFEKLRKQYNGLQLVIAGGGETEPIKNFISQNQLEEIVKMPGYMDKYGFYNQVDCVIMNSKFEGFGRVTIEAMKSRKLLLGRKSTGTYELIGENERGLLFENEADFMTIINKLMAGNFDVAKVIDTAQRWAESNTEPAAAAGKVLDYLEKE